MCSKIENNSDSVSHWVRQVTGRYNRIKNRKEIEIYIQKNTKNTKVHERTNKHVFTATPSWIQLPLYALKDSLVTA